VLEDVKEALKWYRASAERGYAMAQIALARKYEWGRGVPADKAKAYALCLLAQKNLSAEWLTKSTSILESELTPEKKAKALEILKQLEKGNFSVLDAN
ncbi:MAG: sel1 repeat family protein, partial [Opitutales bacterium]|nr:sel1 repeat family protein [Opitutales bacterium]